MCLCRDTFLWNNRKNDPYQDIDMRLSRDKFVIP